MLLSEAKKTLSPEKYLAFLKKQGLSEQTANFIAGIETGEVKGDYTVIEKKQKELEMDENTNTADMGFMSWMTPGVAIKEAGDAPAAEASTTDETGKKALHITVGESLSKYGVQPTKDLYGVHAEEHGSAWVAPKNQFQALTKAMWQMGYRPGGKGIFKRGAVQIDMGQDDKNVFVYITDDNGPKVVVPGSAMKKKEAPSYLDANGQPDRRLMDIAYAALTVGYHGQKYKGADRAEALAALIDIYHSMGENYPGEGEE